MGSALLNTTTDSEFAGTPRLSAPPAVLAEATDPRSSAAAEPYALRMQVAERLAAHRGRRSAQASSEMISPAQPTRSGNPRSARIAAAVAERYAHTPSYRAFLAAEANRAIEQARAAAEVAAMNAQAIADAQQTMLDAFDQDAMQRAAHNQAQIAEAQIAEGQAAMQEEFHTAHAVTLQKTSAVALNLWPDLARGQDREQTRRTRPETQRATIRGAALDAREKEAARPAASPAPRSGGLTVRLYEDTAGTAQEYRGVTHRAPTPAHTNRREYRNDAEAQALDEEIAFRQAPVFEEPAGPPVPLPANLIEFPRHLVASRKARPRIAEGPLRDEDDAAPLDGQLRIFEVDAAHISTLPVEADAVTPQWTSIWLDTPPQAAHKEEYADLERGLDQGDALVQPHGVAVPALQPASIMRRVFAGGIDVSIVTTGVLAFAATSLWVFSRFNSWNIGAGFAGGSMLQILRPLAASIAAQTGVQPSQFAVIGALMGVFLILIYQAMFFWFSEATPGMRCARIALCTFDDENPTRRAIRRRLGAMLLSACSLGMGFAWAMLDEQRLTWHDRITRMYLRSY